MAARCREISEDGMVLEALKQPLEKCSGVVEVSNKGMTVELDARIVRSESQWSVLEFIYKSEEERNTMAHFVALAVEPQNRPGPQLVD